MSESAEFTPAPTTADADSKQVDLQKARDAGWTETVAFDYDAFQRTGGHDGNWLGQGAVYEWSGDYGDVAPEVKALEDILFGSEHLVREGQHRTVIDELDVNIEGPAKVQPITKFADAGLHPVVLQNINLAGYTKPTPIQCYAISAVQSGHDVVGIAQTGSGKTAAYLIPIISKLMGKAKKLQAPRPDTTRGFDRRSQGVRAEPLVVIIVPTRELAIQIFDEARRMCYRSMLRPCVAYGGYPMGACLEELAKGCDILIGTPGRLTDLMDRPEVLTMSRVKFTVVDEADEMLDADWEEELNKLMAGGDTNEDADHVYMMFSATFPKGAREMARKYMSQDYVRVRVGRAGQAHKNIKQEIIYVDQDNKRVAVYDLLFKSKPERTLIFCNSKAAVDLLDDYLYNKQMPTTSIHADRNQREREDAIRAFRTGRAPILIATGISARGWDVAGVGHVINYDLPSTDHGGISEYIHRIGRTARIGNQGLATSFYNDRNEDLAQDIVNVLIECEQTVPDFLEHLKPEEGAKLEFNDDTDDEADGGDGFGSAEGGFGSAEGGFGSAEGGFGASTDDAAPAASAWGAPAEAADAGFTADGGAQNASSW